MSAAHRDNPVTRETVWRVYQLPEELRAASRERRQALGQTVREFLAYAVETELPGLLQILRDCLPAPAVATRPMRLPLTEALLGQLRAAGDETGLPAARLLLACLARAAARKRRRRGSADGAAQSGSSRPRRPERRGRREQPAGLTNAAAAPAPAEASPAQQPPAAAGGEAAAALTRPGEEE